MKLRWLIVVITGMIAIGLTGCVQQPPDLDAIGSVCLVVEQKHPQVDGDFSLPLEEVLHSTLDKMGLVVLEPGQPCDATFTVSLIFKVREAHFPTLNLTCANGSEATGEARLDVDGFHSIQEPLHGLWDTTALTTCWDHTSFAIYDETWREAMLQAMVNVWGEPAVTALLEMGSFGEQYRQMFEKGLISEDEVVPVLVQALNNENEMIQLNAMRALLRVTLAEGRTRDKAVSIMRKTDGIVDLFLDLIHKRNSPEIREGATGFLGKLTLEPDQVVPVLISLLDDESEDLRVNAMVSLRYYGPDAAEAIPALELMLHDKSPRIQWAAKEALDAIR